MWWVWSLLAVVSAVASANATHEGAKRLSVHSDKLYRFVSGFGRGGIGLQDIARCLRYGADPNNARNPLYRALADTDGVSVNNEEERLELLELLLKNGADPNSNQNRDKSLFRQELGYFPLHRAARSRDAWLLSLLLTYNADPNVRDDQGWTPLMHAVAFGNAEAVRMLHEHGARLDVVGQNGETPVHVAANGFHSKGGEQKYGRDKHGVWVEYKGLRRWIVEFFLAHGANINAEDVDGKTPLHWAVSAIGTNSTHVDSTGWGQTVKHPVEDIGFLVAKGADPDHPDNDGVTPRQADAQLSKLLAEPESGEESAEREN